MLPNSYDYDGKDDQDAADGFDFGGGESEGDDGDQLALITKKNNRNGGGGHRCDRCGSTNIQPTDDQMYKCMDCHCACAMASQTINASMDDHM